MKQITASQPVFCIMLKGGKYLIHRRDAMDFRRCCNNVGCTCNHRTNMSIPGFDFPRDARVAEPPPHDNPRKKPSARVSERKPPEGLCDFIFCILMWNSLGVVSPYTELHLCKQVQIWTKTWSVNDILQQLTHI